MPDEAKDDAKRSAAAPAGGVPKPEPPRAGKWTAVTPPQPVLPGQALPTPKPVARTERIEIQGPASSAPESGAKPPEAPAHRDRPGIRALTETLAVLLFLGLTVIPLARFGVVPLDQKGQITLLIVTSVLLVAAVLLYPLAGYRPKGALEERIAARRRDDAVLNWLSAVSVILLTLIVVIETVATLVFLNVVKGTTQAVVTAAGHFILFSCFVLLFVDLLLIARTSFDSRHRPKTWHKDVAQLLLGVSVVVLVLALLKNLDVLGAGLFARIRPEQSPYILTIAALFQLVAFRLLLRYPSMTQVFANEIDLARRATKGERLRLEQRALRAYLVGLGFVLISFLLIGGVATGRVAKGDQRSVNVIVVGYVLVAVAILLVVLIRYLQHKWIRDRAARAAAGELIARRRLTRDQLAAIFTYSFSAIFAALFLALSILTFMARTPFKPSLGTDFLIMAFLVGVGPFGFRRAVQMRRVRMMDDKFPDFLRDLAEGLRAGMTLPRALYVSSRGIYGGLTPEIQHMSAQVEWGVSFSEALQRFSQRVKTPLIERTVSLITEASKAGGSVVDILTAAAQDAREIKQIIEDRRRQMGIYSVIIYVAFVVFLVVVFVLAAQFLPSFQDAVKGASGQQVGGLSFAPFKTTEYVRIFWHAALIQGIGGGLVAGVMTDSHPLGGLKHSFLMVLISWVFFRGFIA